MKKGLVSIIIPCYNAEKYLDKCLNSILNQTYKPIELIVVDDGSTDNSAKIIKSYETKLSKANVSLTYVFQENAGVAAAVDRALKYVSGEFLMWQDADDWYELDAVENLHQFLKENPKINVVRGEAAFRHEGNIDVIEHHAKSKYSNNTNLFDSYLMEKDSYCWPGVFMCRMKHFDSRIKNRTILNSLEGQNAQLILPITYNEVCGYLNKIVYNYLVRDDSHSHMKRSLYKKLKRNRNFRILFTDIVYTINNMELKQKKYYRRKLKRKHFFKNFYIIYRHFGHNIKHFFKK